MTTLAWPSSRLITAVRCGQTRLVLRVLDQLQHGRPRAQARCSAVRSFPLSLAAATAALTACCSRSPSVSALSTSAAESSPICSSMWCAQPGRRGELHPVGLLVQADPEPEVLRLHVEFALHRRRCSAPPAVSRAGRGRRRAAARRTDRTGPGPCWRGRPGWRRSGCR